MRAKGVIDYMMVVVGVLAAISALVLLGAFRVISLEQTPGVMTLLMSFPVLVDIFVLSPGIPQLFLVLTLTPLLLVIVVAIRTLIGAPKRPVKERKASHAKYNLLQLSLFGIGATVGPSVFVVLPEAVHSYGTSALIGVSLASLSALLLAFIYARMDYLTYKLGTPSVGGPAFVKQAYGHSHPAYLASRFSMWVANTSIAAFNMIVLMDVVTLYVVPDLLNLINSSHLAEAINFPLRALIFILSILSLRYAESEESLVRLQSMLGPVFVLLFMVHVAAVASLPGPVRALPIEVPPSLMAMAYVYMVVFGFQEIQSLAEGVPGTPEERESLLKKALAISVLLPAALFLAYSYSLLKLPEIPRESIPAVSVLSGYGRALTEGALLLGIATTFIPALVTASNHLREMLVDVFEVRAEVAESPLGKYLVAFFVLLLLSADATYLIELTDFGVLISMAIIAISELRLSKLAKERSNPLLPVASAAFTVIAAVVLAYKSPDVAYGGVLFILVATIALGVAAYELEIVEYFALVTSVLALLAAPSVVKGMEELSSVGALPPSTVAFLPFTKVAMDIIEISALALVAKLLIRNRRKILEFLVPLITYWVSRVEGWVKREGHDNTG